MFTPKHGAGPRHPWAMLRLLAMCAVLVAVGCWPSVPPPTATPAARTSPRPRATVTLIVPTPPPPATLTALIRAYQLTRTPGLRLTATAQVTGAQAQETPIPQATESVTTAPPPTAPPATQVTEPTIQLVPEAAESGALIAVRGTGWQPGEPVSISLGPSLEAITTEETRTVAEADGDFSASFNVPASWEADSLIVLAESLDGLRRAVAWLYVIRPTATPLRLPSSTPSPVPSPTPQIAGWRGEYFAGRDLRGPPVLVRDDANLGFAWHAGPPAPELPSDNFSVRWTRTFNLAPGGYRFQVRVDDGVRVWIDDQLLIDEWHVSAPADYSANLVLDGGPTEIRVEYFDAGGNAELSFSWTYLGRFPDWRGSYYNSRVLSGPAALVRNDVAIDFNWGDGSPSPEIQPDNFSVRWTRSVGLSAGTYRFHAQADDGVRVWVDGQLIIDEWHVSTGDQHYTADVNLTGGMHDLRIEYFESGGKAEVYVWWENLTAYTDWRGAYYDNRSLSGQPAFVRNDREIDFDWGRVGPDGIGPDNYSIRWTRGQSFEGGTYRFFAEHDDGVRLWVDGQLLIDEWYETGPVTHHADETLIAGGHEIQVEYFQGSGGARIRVWWEKRPYE